MPVYSDREQLKHRPDGDRWVDIDDIEFFALGNTDRVAEGEEPPPQTYPDPVTDPQKSLKAATDVAVSRRLSPTTPKERIVVTNGEVVVQSEHGQTILKRMQYMDVPQSGALVTNALPLSPEGMRPQTEVARIAGHWQEVIRTAIFRFGPGRPCDYHYHDGDEYWFVFRGHFTLRFRGEDHWMTPGSILAAGMGEEHGALAPEETFEGIGFATQLEGQKRDGHLWCPIHGEPVPVRQQQTASMA